MKKQNLELSEVYLFKLVKTSQAFKQYAYKILSENGLPVTSDQWMVLKRVDEKPKINQRELAKDVFKDPASITRILEGLEKRNLVKRFRGDDRRTFNVSLTNEGKDFVSRALELAVSIRSQGLKGLTVEEHEIFERALDKVFKNFSM